MMEHICIYQRRMWSDKGCPSCRSTVEECTCVHQRVEICPVRGCKCSEHCGGAQTFLKEIPK
jgi:hypothetical protein